MAKDEVRPLRRSDTAIIAATLLWIRKLSTTDPLSSQERSETTRTSSTTLGSAAPLLEKMFAVPLEGALYYLNAPESRDRREAGDNVSHFIINRLFDDEADLDPVEITRAVQAANCRSLLNLEAARHYHVPYAGASRDCR